MMLRRKLLLVALSTLALPWAGWESVKQTEALLRQGQEQALLATAQSLAKALAAVRIPLPATGASFYVHRVETAPAVDGYVEDWSALRPYAQLLGPPADPQKLRTLLCANDAGLYLLIEARDATRTRVDASDPRAARSDHVTLGLTVAGETRHYRLASAAPGSFEAAALDGGDALPEHLSGEWQEDGSGYRIELRLARGDWPERMSVGLYDADAGGDVVEPESRALVSYSNDLSVRLGEFVPDPVRVRLLSGDGWLLASAQAKRDAADAPARQTAARGWAQRTFYRLLIAPALTGSPALDEASARVDAPEIWQALSGVPSTSWRAGETTADVTLSAAVPLTAEGEVRGVLLLDRSSDALPLLANRALLGLAAATLAALVVAASVLLLFGARLSFRIRRLRNAADTAMRGGGESGAPLPLVDADDELGDLARSFGKLLDEVGAYTDYLRTLASKLSHELNTPLAIVKSSLDNLDHAALPESARPYLARARDGAERLGAIVRAMSEASRMERAIASAEAEDFDLRALVLGCGEGYRPLVAPRELRVVVPESTVPFHGAPELIAQALDKLVDNARSFTPETGWIELALERTDAGARVRVANAGPLLPAAMQERLFDSLVSVREAAARVGGETPHLGLGLYVVRLIAELHRGRASARNRAEGDGVEFALDLAGMPRQRMAGG